MGAAADSALVVGGGIIGIACAHYLQAAGFRVVVIDQGEIGGACSHANCGMICPSHVLPLTEPGAVAEGLRSLFNPGAPFRIKPQFRPALLQWMLQFARRCNRRQMLSAGHSLLPILESSLNEYRRLFAAGLEGEWKENGLLYVFRSARGLEQFAATDRLLREEYGIGARRLEGDALSAFEPALRPDLAGGYFYEHDGSARPDALIRDWVSRLAAEGVEFISGCRMRDVRRAGTAIDALDTDRGPLRADRYVFATGAWSRLLERSLGCRLPVEPGKGYSLTMTRPATAPRHPMLFPEHRVGVTPFDTGYRLGSMMEFAGFDSSIPERRMDQLRDSAQPYLLQPTGPEVQERWYGWRPMTWDSLPVIGRVPGVDNALLATGHNMVGLTLAPATGRLVAELARERTPHIDIEAFSVARF